VTLAFAKLGDIPTSVPQSFKFQFKFGAKYPFDSPEVIFIGDHIPGHKSHTSFVSSSLMFCQNKLECLSLENIFNL
jgi:hypothetical protein